MVSRVISKVQRIWLDAVLRHLVSLHSHTPGLLVGEEVLATLVVLVVSGAQLSPAFAADRPYQIFLIAAFARVGPGVDVPVARNGDIGHGCPPIRACAVAALASGHAGTCATPSIFTVSFVVEADIDGQGRGGEGENDGRVEHIGRAENCAQEFCGVVLSEEMMMRMLSSFERRSHILYQLSTAQVRGPEQYANIPTS
jgi:hypothetical protein